MFGEEEDEDMEAVSIAASTDFSTWSNATPRPPSDIAESLAASREEEAAAAASLNGSRSDAASASSSSAAHAPAADAVVASDPTAVVANANVGTNNMEDEEDIEVEHLPAIR